MQRQRETNGDEVMTQMLWFDPSKAEESADTKHKGISFSPVWTAEFCSSMEVDYVIRSHEAVNGHVVHENHGGRVVTLFSCPVLSDKVQNRAEFVIFRGDKPLEDPHQWEYVEIKPQKGHPHPLYRYIENECSVM